MSVRQIIGAVLLGLSTSFFWAAQHPLQSPLYKELSQSKIGFLEGIIVSQIFSLFLFLLFFCLPYTRKCISSAKVKQSWFKFVIKISSISILSLTFYAIGQSSIDGITIALILSTSPASAVIFSIILHRTADANGNKGYFWAALLRKKTYSTIIESKEFWIHIGLAFIVFISIYINSGNEDIVFKLNSIWDFTAMLLIFFVPIIYFASNTYTRELFDGGIEQQLGASFISGLLIAPLIAAAIAIGLFVSGYNFKINAITMEIVVFFFIAVLSINLIAEILLQIALRLDKESYDLTALFYHTTPLFSYLIGFLGGNILGYDYFKPKEFQLYTGLLLVIVLILHSLNKMKKGGDLYKFISSKFNK